jgi:hypothetical protein
MSEPAACPNCFHPFEGAPPRFCPACGQETQVRPPRLGEFLQQFGGAYLSTEGALWRTLKLLLFKPGELTRQYLAGRRKHYVLPLRLYLTVSVVVLLVLRAMAAADFDVGPKVNFNGPQPGERPRNVTMKFIGGGSAGLKEGHFFCDGVPAWICKRLQRRIDIEPAAVAGEVAAFRERLTGNLGAAMFLLLPSFALWLKLVYWNRRMHYTEHLVFALHVHAFWFIAFGLALLDTPWLKGLAALAVPVYTMFALRRVYGGRWWPRWLRAGLVSLLYLVVLAFAFVLLALFTLLA